MKRQLKIVKVISLIVMGFIFITTPVLVHGAPINQRVFDEASLFSPEEVGSLENQVLALQELMDADVAIVTTIDTLGLSTFDFMDTFYNEMNLGFGDDESGVLFIIDMDNRMVDMITAGKMIDLLTDARIDDILDRVMDAMIEGNHYQAANNFLTGVEGYYLEGRVEGQYRLTDQRVFDQAQFFTESESQELINRIHELENLMDMDILIITTNQMGDLSHGMFFQRFYEENGFNQRISPNEAALLLDGDTQTMTIQATGVMRDYLTPSRRQAIFRNIQDPNNFTKAMTFLEMLESFYQQGKHRIFDEAQLFTDSENQELYTRLQEVENEIGVGVRIITTNQIEGISPETFMNNFLEINGNLSDGITLLMDRVTGSNYIQVDGMIREYFPESRLKNILEKMIGEAGFASASIFLDSVESYYQDGIPLPPVTWQEWAIMSAISLSIGWGFYQMTLVNYRKGTSTPSFLLRENSQLNLTHKQDQFLNQRISKTRLPKDPPNSNSGGSGGYSGGGSRGATRSTTRSSSSGGSRGGGRGRSF